MSDLERATDVVMEAMGCEYAYDSAARAGFCSRHDFGWLVSDRACGHASRIAKAVVESNWLATLLAETRADELLSVAAEFESSANRVVKAKGETERTRYAHEVVEVLRNRADEVRRG